MPTTQHQPTTPSTLASLRALVPNRRLTKTEVRQITERQANRLRKLLHVTDDRFPTQALTHLPRVELRPEPDMPNSGLALWNGNQWLILVNTNETIARQRFSTLHELHHVIAHTTKTQMFGNEDMRNPEAEITADYFAACVLMPKLLVKRYWGQGPRTITALAKRFGVSAQAMSYRLDQLGLSEPKQRCRFTRPTTAVDDETDEPIIAWSPDLILEAA